MHWASPHSSTVRAMCLRTLLSTLDAAMLWCHSFWTGTTMPIPPPNQLCIFPPPSSFHGDVSRWGVCVLRRAYSLDRVDSGLVVSVSAPPPSTLRWTDVGDEGLVGGQLHTPLCVRQDPTKRTDSLQSHTHTQPLTVWNDTLTNHSQAVCRTMLLQSQSRSI